MTLMELKAKVAAQTWFHTIDLGNGITTPGIDNTPLKMELMNFPKDMRGKTVIDIGAWNGGLSFECERRGAKRVLATDYYCWHGDNGSGRQGFELAKEALQSKVEALEIKVEDLSPKTVGLHDIAIFAGVLYHTEDPLGYLRRVRSVCREYAVIETQVGAMDFSRPALEYYPANTLNGDATNFFGPNQLAVEAMCRDVGFSTVEKVGEFYGNRMCFIATV